MSHDLWRLITNQWNVCSVCRREVPESRPAFAGYDLTGAPAFVGACCADRLAELATPVYWSGTLNLAVGDDQLLWRYMDFSKFTSMLSQRGLYFPRLDKLGDPFEGAAGLASREGEWDRHYLNFFKQAVTTPPPGYPRPDFSPDEVEAEARRLLSSLKGERRFSSDFASCWHKNTVELEALWRLYCPPASAGVAIQSRAKALWEATRAEPSAVVGRVHYLDFRQSYASLDQRAFCKRMSLSHENEVRAVLRASMLKADILEKWGDGHLVTCDLSALIDCVVISPFAPPWFRDVLRATIARFGYDFEVRTSELVEQPFF